MPSPRRPSSRSSSSDTTLRCSVATLSRTTQERATMQIPLLRLTNSAGAVVRVFAIAFGVDLLVSGWRAFGSSGKSFGRLAAVTQRIQSSNLGFSSVPDSAPQRAAFKTENDHFVSFIVTPVSSQNSVRAVQRDSTYILRAKGFSDQARS